ncbi:uracil-DNA glycosylase [Yoonia sp. R2331]|uniref:uracil-DNA glycosylase n=1 Tax=Yoonia sp. R2331 TaxID=3237238 RepID=UPI0034E4078C
MESANTYWADRALLEWYIDLGADEALEETPIDRYALNVPLEKPVQPVEKNPEISAPVVQAEPDAVAVATAAAEAAQDLGQLAQVMQDFDLCELKRGAKSFVFCDGQPGARVMVVGEAPGRQEDIAGKPFVGQAGQLLDKMLAAIGLDRAAQNLTDAVYITNVMPWRPPSNATPSPEEIAMMLPFLQRHITLANPDVLVLMGNTPCQALLGRAGITRIRGTWAEAVGRPALPMFHPAYLLRQTAAKREAWADLLTLKARLKDAT